jgi:hypothetical protein
VRWGWHIAATIERPRLNRLAALGTFSAPPAEKGFWTAPSVRARRCEIGIAGLFVLKEKRS